VPLLSVVGGTVNGRPFADDVEFAGPGVAELCMEEETGINAEAEDGLVLKVDGEGVIFAGGEQLDFFDCPALHLSELHKLAARKTTFN
jgi:hypothetical protein